MTAQRHKAKAKVPVAGRQALKTQRTRARLLDSTLGLIRDGGYSAATATAIARGAGITWGAAQHQFGSKEDILEEILGLAYARFIAVMSAPGLLGGSRGQRTEEFVRRMWQHYQGDYYRVSLEILRATHGSRGQRARAWEQRQGRAHLRVVRQLFPESAVSDAQLREALTFAHCCLTGLAIERIFKARASHIERHLARVARVLQAML
jgi:AcrR family transcriptional regulator